MHISLVQRIGTKEDSGIWPGLMSISVRRGIVLGLKVDPIYVLDLTEAIERHWGLILRFGDCGWRVPM